MTHECCGSSGLERSKRPCYHRVTSCIRHVMYVEFLGIPRERAGISELEIEARHPRPAARTAGHARSLRLAELITADRLHPSIAANLNGDEFVSDPRDTPLAEDDRLLILSADAGG